MPYPLPTSLDAWKYERIDNFVGGVDQSKRVDELEKNQAVTLKNTLLREGTVYVDTGYKVFANSVNGFPQGSFRFEKQSGLVEQMLITTTTLYTYNTSKRAWFLVAGLASTTVTVGAGPGGVSIVVASAAGFATGNLVGIILSDGTQLQTLITVSGTTFTLTTPIPAGLSVAVGAVVVKSVALSGTLDLQVSACVVASHDWFVFTNGVNKPQYYDTASCQPVPNLPSAGDTICKAVAVYNTALFLVNTTEGGTPHPQRVRRSDQTDPTEWVAGTAGFDDLLDAPDQILCAHVLGPYLIVYRSGSIYRGEFIGAGGVNYRFDQMVSGEGVLSTNSVVSEWDYHIVVGNSNIYEYRGDFSLKPIGDPVFKGMFSAFGNLNPLYKRRTFALFVHELSEVWILYVTNNDSLPNLVVKYQTDKKAWYMREFANQFIGFGFFALEATATWDDLIGSWDDIPWTWDSRVTLSQAATIHLCDGESGQVFEYDYFSVLDNATAIQYNLETKDFSLTDCEIRFDMIEMFIQGTGVTLEYSTDGGVSWTLLQTITQSTLNKVQVYKQFLCNRVRFRWTGNSSDFKLNWFAFSYKLESLY